MDFGQVLGDIGYAAASLIIVILLLGFGHYFRWDMFIRGGLPVLARYVYGVSSLLAGFTFWQMGDGGGLVPVIRFGLLAMAGGVAVFIFYKIDGMGHFIDVAQRKNGQRNGK